MFLIAFKCGVFLFVTAIALGVINIARSNRKPPEQEQLAPEAETDRRKTAMTEEQVEIKQAKGHVAQIKNDGKD